MRGFPSKRACLPFRRRRGGGDCDFEWRPCTPADLDAHVGRQAPLVLDEAIKDDPGIIVGRRRVLSWLLIQPGVLLPPGG